MTLDARRAGAVPNTRVVSAVMATVNIAIRTSIDMIEKDRVDRRGELTDEKTAAPGRHQKARDGAGDRQQDALRQELAGKAPARFAERHSKTQLVPPHRRPREQQIGDVHARDQQHQAGDDHHRPERAFIAAAEIRRTVESSPGGQQPEGLSQVALDRRGAEISELADGRIPYLSLRLTQSGRRRVE